MRALYGLVRDRPRWYVRWRGMRWLRHGWCPCCYSSPPRPDCPVCEGDNDYGPHMKPYGKALLWRRRWLGL